MGARVRASDGRGSRPAWGMRMGGWGGSQSPTRVLAAVRLTPTVVGVPNIISQRASYTSKYKP
jgi:hypothetical protein